MTTRLLRASAGTRSDAVTAAPAAGGGTLSIEVSGDTLMDTVLRSPPA